MLMTGSLGTVASTPPAVAMAFDAHVAGRGLWVYNLVVLVGVFVLQWGIGLAVDAFSVVGWTQLAAFRAALGLSLPVIWRLGCGSCGLQAGHNEL